MTLEDAIRKCAAYPMTQKGCNALIEASETTPNESEIREIALHLRQVTLWFDGPDGVLNLNEKNRELLRNHKQFSANPSEKYIESTQHPLNRALDLADACELPEETKHILVTHVQNYSITLLKSYIEKVISTLKNKNLIEELVTAHHLNHFSHLTGINPSFKQFDFLFVHTEALQKGDTTSINDLISNNMGLPQHFITDAARDDLQQLYDHINKIQDALVDNSLIWLKDIVTGFTIEAWKENQEWDKGLNLAINQLEASDSNEDKAKARLIQSSPTYELTKEILTILGNPDKRNNKEQLQAAAQRISQIPDKHKAIRKHLEQLLSNYQEIALEKYIDFARQQLEIFNSETSYQPFATPYSAPDLSLIANNSTYTNLSALLTGLKEPGNLTWITQCQKKADCRVLKNELNSAVNKYKEQQQEERRLSSASTEADRSFSFTSLNAIPPPSGPSLEDRCTQKIGELNDSLEDLKNLVTEPSNYRYTVFFLCFSFTLPQWLCSKRPKGVSDLADIFQDKEFQFDARTSLMTFSYLLEALNNVIETRTKKSCCSYYLFGGARNETTETLYSEWGNTLKAKKTEVTALLNDQSRASSERRPGGYTYWQPS